MFPANIYLFKVNNRNSRKRCELGSKLTIKTPARRRRRSGLFIDNSEPISKPFSSVSIVDFEQVNVCWIRKSFRESSNFFILITMIKKSIEHHKCFMKLKDLTV